MSKVARPFYVEREGPQFACVHYLGTGLRYFDLSEANRPVLRHHVQQQLLADFNSTDDLDVVLSALERI